MERQREMKCASDAVFTLDPDGRPSSRRGATRCSNPDRCRRYFRVVEPSACLNASNTRACWILGDADTGVLNREVNRHARSPATAREPDVHGDLPACVNFRALPRRLTMIWRQPVHIAHEPARARLVRRCTPAPALFVCPYRERFHRVGDGFAQIELDRVEIDLSRFNLREIKDVVDDRQQAVRGRLRQSGGTLAAPAAGPCRGPAPSSRVSPFIGVRISWLMFARNSLLARLAASATSFASRRCSV